jgi:uncharacterized damage-inducible protein DinB
MDQFFADYWDRLNEMNQAIIEAIRGLPPAGLDWLPGPEMNSLAVLTAHTAGAQRYWIGDIVGQEESGRVRDEEFVVEGETAVSLIGRMQAAGDHSQQVLVRLALTDLPRERLSPRHNRTFTVSWSLLHALEHTSTHTGHIQITRQLWDKQSK